MTHQILKKKEEEEGWWLIVSRRSNGFSVERFLLYHFAFPMQYAAAEPECHSLCLMIITTIITDEAAEIFAPFRLTRASRLRRRP